MTRIARVAINVTEETGGVFQSGLASALRGLGDIAVVGREEEPNYVFKVIVLCDTDECDDASSYAVSVAVTQPIVGDMIRLASMQADSTQEMSFEHADKMAEQLASYEYTGAAWVARWGRNVRDRSIRELVARIDRACFEPLRLSRRVWRALEEARDSTTVAALGEQYRESLGEC